MVVKLFVWKSKNYGQKIQPWKVGTFLKMFSTILFGGWDPRQKPNHRHAGWAWHHKPWGRLGLPCTSYQAKELWVLLHHPKLLPVGIYYFILFDRLIVDAFYANSLILRPFTFDSSFLNTRFCILSPNNRKQKTCFYFGCCAFDNRHPT